MDFATRHRRPSLSWLAVMLLTALCAVLGILQYRWIGEVTHAETATLREELTARLRSLGHDFDKDINSSWMALLPAGRDPLTGRDEAFQQRYLKWQRSGRQAHLFRRVFLAEPQGESVVLREFKPGTGALRAVEWPPEWNAMRERFLVRIKGKGPFGPNAADPDDTLEIPHIGPPPGSTGLIQFSQLRELDWLIFQLDLDYLRNEYVPDLIEKYLGARSRDYQIEIVNRAEPSKAIFAVSGTPRIGEHADALAGMFSVQYDMVFRRWAPTAANSHTIPPSLGDRGKWLIAARHRSGSLDAVVAQARRRNLAVTSAVLLLMLGAIYALFHFTQRAQRLSDLQMEFVAGVSHELRTPVSVIRTAAHNLGAGLVANPSQVQRYGTLIEDEAGKLTAIVEQVLSFSSAEAGRAVRARETVQVGTLIEEALEASARTLNESHCALERSIAASLPPVMGDPLALKHALQNLLANAAKYGADGASIEVSASAHGGTVEIEVADRGPGIPREEISQIFDPFFRGKKAIADQIHGTGLGLSLVKRIVEAHGGTVTARNRAGGGAVFTLRFPAAAQEAHELAHTSDRG